MRNVRSVDQLVVAHDSAWPDVLRLVKDARVPVLVLPADPSRAEEVLNRLQVSVGTCLGAIAHRCGGMIIDHGWLRLLGAGFEELPSIATVNNLPEPNGDAALPALVVALDVVGGQYAIDGGGLFESPGTMCYFAPDTLAWETLRMSYCDFVAAALTGDLAELWFEQRWLGWETEVSALPLGQGITSSPPMYGRRYRRERVTRTAIAYGELVGLHNYLAEKLRQLQQADAAASG